MNSPQVPTVLQKSQKTSTSADLRDYYIRMAEEAKARAFRRKDKIRDDTEHDLTLKFGVHKINRMGTERFKIEVDFVTGRFMEHDPSFKGHVADNQWYIQQSIMHGNAATEIAIRDLIKVMSNGQRA